MRTKFEEQLALLHEMLVEMGAMIEKAIAMAIGALTQQNGTMALEAIAFDNEIDQMEKDIEALCLQLLLQQQPVAKDLRLISAALKMITDMERIGDQAADISEIALMLIDETYIKKLDNLPQMAITASKMVTESIDAFVKKDLDLAYAVIESDDVVDMFFTTIKNNLIELIREDQENGGQAIDLMMIAKYFERIGDHATNIAEWVVFSIMGKHWNEQA
ncbi:MAG: phosphate signaling complex protein PhoU [Oscillospiraceae bacterium]|nr:phosphate signaling complex protein PhoU [Oscillospiraceae bacterium]